MDAFLELFSTRGRANRAWYFWHVLLDDLVMVTLVVALLTLGVVIGSPFIFLPVIGVLIAGVWAGIAITVKRLHDLGMSGFHWLGFMVPIYNLYLGCIVLFKKGTEGANPYGPDPLDAPRASGYLEG